VVGAAAVDDPFAPLWAWTAVDAGNISAMTAPIPSSSPNLRMLI
jgi:hypothetical protein